MHISWEEYKSRPSLEFLFLVILSNISCTKQSPIASVVGLIRECWLLISLQ